MKADGNESTAGKSREGADDGGDVLFDAFAIKQLMSLRGLTVKAHIDRGPFGGTPMSL